MIISKTKGKRILLVHDLCDHNTLDESALDKLSNVLGEHEIEVCNAALFVIISTFIEVSIAKSNCCS